ncbi:MAG: hypothetical protein WA732_17825, partial [Pseudolabrys sp.]
PSSLQSFLNSDSARAKEGGNFVEPDGFLLGTALHSRCTLGHAATGCATRLSIRRSSRVIYQYSYCLRLFSKFVLRLPRVCHTPLGGGFLNGQPNNDWGGRMSAFGGKAYMMLALQMSAFDPKRTLRSQGASL